MEGRLGEEFFFANKLHFFANFVAFSISRVSFWPSGVSFSPVSKFAQSKSPANPLNLGDPIATLRQPNLNLLSLSAQLERNVW